MTEIDKSYHIFIDDSLNDSHLKSIISRTKCDGILLLCDEKPDLLNYPPIPVFPIYVNINTFSWESLNEIHLELSRFTKVFYMNLESLVTIYVCLNPSSLSPLTNFLLYQCLSYLHILSMKINNIKPRSTRPAFSIITYTVYENEAIFLPFLSTKTPEVLNALLEICSENGTEKRYITTKNLENALSGDEISLKPESIKNRFLHLKKQLRGYPGYQESFKGIHLSIFRLDLKKIE